MPRLTLFSRSRHPAQALASLARADFSNVAGLTLPIVVKLRVQPNYPAISRAKDGQGDVNLHISSESSAPALLLLLQPASKPA